MTRPRAQTMPLQGLVNRVMRGLLRTPLLSRAMGGQLVTLYVTGRKSGRRYTIPVAYLRDGGDLLIGTPFGWGQQPADRRAGHDPAAGTAAAGRRAAPTPSEAEVTSAYATMSRANRAFASFNKVSVDAAGNPSPADLHLAWAGRSTRVPADAPLTRPRPVTRGEGRDDASAAPRSSWRSCGVDLGFGAGQPSSLTGTRSRRSASVMP